MLVSNSKFEHWCRQIQLEECLTYLRGRAELNNLAPPIGDKLVSILRACLVECSVSVMQYIKPPKVLLLARKNPKSLENAHQTLF